MGISHERGTSELTASPLHVFNHSIPFSCFLLFSFRHFHLHPNSFDYEQWLSQQDSFGEPSATMTLLRRARLGAENGGLPISSLHLTGEYTAIPLGHMGLS